MHATLCTCFQVGKTCTLLEVVPAVVSTALRKRPDCAFSNITLLHLDGDSLFRQASGRGFLCWPRCCW